MGKFHRLLEDPVEPGIEPWVWCATLALIGAVTLFQPIISISGGYGWDGNFYIAMANGNHSVELPFRLRIAVPLLVKLVSPAARLRVGFKVLNFLAGGAYAIVAIGLLRKAYPAISRGALIVAWLLLSASELAPIRNSGWCPANTDSFFMLEFAVLFALALKPASLRRDLLIALTCFCGIITRENFLFNFALIPLLTAVRFRDSVEISMDRRALRASGLALLGLALGCGVIKRVSGSSIFASKSGVMTGWLQYFSFSQIVAAIAMVYGFFALLTLGTYGLPRTRHPLRPNLWTFFALTLLIAWVGGGNTERFLYWYSLIVTFLFMPELDAAIRGRRYGVLAICLTWFITMNRIFLPIDPLRDGNLQAGCNFGQYLLGRTPALGHYIWVCPKNYSSPFIGAFLICIVVVVALRIRWVLPRSERNVSGPAALDSVT